MGNRSGQGQAHDQVKTEAETRQRAPTPVWESAG